MKPLADFDSSDRTDTGGDFEFVTALHASITLVWVWEIKHSISISVAYVHVHAHTYGLRTCYMLVRAHSCATWRGPQCERLQ